MATNVEKITISLPKKDISLIKQFETKTSLSRSKLIRKAVEEWLKRKHRDLMEQKYKDYYSDKHIRKKQREFTERMFEISKETWPEY